jgi:hypothetical protein
MAPASSRLGAILADNSQRPIDVMKGDTAVLTFFDYLRQRAFESILAGAQEALEHLENEHTSDRTDGHASRRPSAALAPPEDGAQRKAQNNAPRNISVPEDDDPLPPPRRRGRPCKNRPRNR